MLLLSLATASASAQYFRGVNLSGAEWGSVAERHAYSSQQTFNYFATKGLNLFRICVRWEHLQPTLSGPLDQTELANLKQNVAWARAKQMKVSIELQNFGRYNTDPNGQLQSDNFVIDKYYDGAIKVSTADLVDFWVRLSQELRDEPAVYAYDLMNEPHDMDTTPAASAAKWEAISQAVVTAIRNNGDDKLIMVPGDSWSNAQFWPQNHHQAWINDPASNFMYEAHIYFDSDYSGSYAKTINGFTYPTTYDAQLALNPNLATVGATRVQPFLDWCRANGVRGYVGEYGIPNDDPRSRWNAVLDGMLAAVDGAGMNGTYWAAGDFWGGYALSVQPDANFTQDKPQLPTLLAHRGAAFLWTVSAANGYLESASPDSLVSGYGPSLIPEGAAADNILVEVTDSSGRTAAATVLFASPGQINYLVPESVTGTRLDVWVKYAGKAYAGGVVRLAGLAPALFSANYTGQGVAAAWLVRVKPDPDLPQIREAVARFDEATQKFVPVPIDFGAEGDRLFIELYGTGFRNAQQPAASTLAVGGTNLALAYVGRQPQYAGLDQANAELPRTLAGSGEIPVVLTVDGQAASQVTLAFK